MTTAKTIGLTIQIFVGKVMSLLFIMLFRFVTAFLPRRAPLVAQLVKNPPAMQETLVDSWVRKVPWRREWLPTPVFWPGELHEPGRLQSMGSQRVGHS